MDPDVISRIAEATADCSAAVPESARSTVIATSGCKNGTEVELTSAAVPESGLTQFMDTLSGVDETSEEVPERFRWAGVSATIPPHHSVIAPEIVPVALPVAPPLAEDT